MTDLLKKIKNWMLSHKIISAIILIAVIFGVYRTYFSGGGAVAIRYVTQAAEKGTLVSSVSGTGQISVSNQFDVKPNVSGNVIYIGVSEGQRVAAGTLIARIDDTDAQKTVRDAALNVQSAQLSLQQMQLSSSNMDTLLNDAFSSISNSFLDFPAEIADAQQVLLSDNLNPKNQTNNDYYKNLVNQSDDVNYRKISLLVDSAVSDYNAARKDFDATFLSYKSTTRTSGKDAVSALLKASIRSATSLSQALKSEQNILDFLTDYFTGLNSLNKLPATMNTYKTTLKSDISQVNSHLSDLTSVSNSIDSAPLNIESQQLSITQRENALADAKANLAYYYIRAPFAGTVAKLNIQNGASVSAGTAVATMINSQKIAEMSFNEVDVGKVKTGQKATLTFDALADITMTGKVVQIDTIGTVTQGVVMYGVKIALDTDNDGIKPGMSVSASVITGISSDVLIVPNSAVKTSGNSSYVQVVDKSSIIPSTTSTGQGVETSVPPKQVVVQTGTSNDSMTEIRSGLNEGEMVVTQTVGGAAKTTTQQSGTAVRIPGLGGFGGGR